MICRNAVIKSNVLSRCSISSCTWRYLCKAVPQHMKPSSLQMWVGTATTWWLAALAKTPVGAAGPAFQLFAAQAYPHSSCFCSHTAFRTLLNHISSDHKMYFLLLFPWHCGVCRCGSEWDDSALHLLLTWEARGREMRRQKTEIKYPEMHQKD